MCRNRTHQGITGTNQFLNTAFSLKKMSASDHLLARLIEKQQKSGCSVSLVSVLNKIGGGISKDIKKMQGKYAVIKTIFMVFLGCATANQYVTTTRTEKTPAWEPKASQFHTYLRTAGCFNTDISS